MINVDQLKPGDIVYEVRSEQAGNTTLRRQSVWALLIKDERTHTYDDGVTVRQLLVARNGSPPRWMSVHLLAKYRRTPPEWLKSGFRGRECYFCCKREADGHSVNCDHPAAKRKRKKAEAKRKPLSRAARNQAIVQAALEWHVLKDSPGSSDDEVAAYGKLSDLLDEEVES